MEKIKRPPVTDLPTVNFEPLVEPLPAKPVDGEEQPASDIFELKSIKLKSESVFPVSLDVASEINNILASGIFKNLESQTLYDKLCDMMLDEKYYNLVETLFWTIFLLRFQPEDAGLLAKLRKRLSGFYSEYFSLLPQPKEELANLSIIGGAYISHVMFFNLFAKDRKLFDMRFILDCYHIVLHEVNGVFVTDIYVQSIIEKIFGNKFFHFEQRIQKKKKPEKRDMRQEPLIRNLQFDLKDLPQVPGGMDLAYELSTKFRSMQKKTKVITLSDISSAKNSLSENRAILALTQPEEKSLISITTDGSSSPYFPKLKFNCHQISPAMSSFLDNSSSTLPFKKKKVISYSSNKPMSNSVNLNYKPPPVEVEPEPKFEKKEKKKNQPKGTISDYVLGNRGDDYYLGYMPQDIKKRHRLELDMKYILDNIKPAMRGTYSVKPLTEPLSKKDTYTPKVESKNAKMKEKYKKEHSDPTKGQSFEKEEDLAGIDAAFGEAIKKEKKEDGAENTSLIKNGKSFDEGPNEFSLPVLKALTRVKEEALSQTKRGSVRKTVVLPKLNEEMTERADVKKVMMPPSLKYYSASNKKLGKGRFFVNLGDLEDDYDDNKDRFKEYKYVDKRKYYVAKHEDSISKDVDANIESLVHRLINKQNNFMKHFVKRPVRTHRNDEI